MYGPFGKKTCQMQSAMFEDVANEQKYFVGATWVEELEWPPREKMEMSKQKKQYVGTVIAVIDVLVVISFMIFISCIKKSQRAYLNKFKDQTIELDDFTIIMRNLPRDIEFENNEDALKACLNQHFEELIKRETAGDPEEEKNIDESSNQHLPKS